MVQERKVPKTYCQVLQLIAQCHQKKHWLLGTFSFFPRKPSSFGEKILTGCWQGFSCGSLGNSLGSGRLCQGPWDVFLLDILIILVYVVCIHMYMEESWKAKFSSKLLKLFTLNSELSICKVSWKSGWMNEITISPDVTRNDLWIF